ncbi:MAG: glycoside hydrolase family 2 protein [Saccharofermentanales bacterium]
MNKTADQSDYERPVISASMDEADKLCFHPKPGPMESKPDIVVLTVGSHTLPAGTEVISLDGIWQLAENGDPALRIAGDFDDSIGAAVPGSIHTALQAAGVIPDPVYAKNDAFAREKSLHSTWWYKTVFKKPGSSNNRLVFDGAGVRINVWLNGAKLGTHEGMFGGPEYDIQPYLETDNLLIVQIEPSPYYICPDGRPNPVGNTFFEGMNVGWMYTVTFNCVYGWHYSNIPSLGIHRSVRIEGQTAVKLKDPFITALNSENALNGIVDLAVTLSGSDSSWAGILNGTIEPENFEGLPYRFDYAIQSSGTDKNIHIQFTIPDPQLWWPNDIGNPSLYNLKLSFIPDDGGVSDYRQIIFGIRSIDMKPAAEVNGPDYYNWKFVINGREMFVKGAGWCTMDFAMDFSAARYDRFLKLAKDQHIQMLRAWGAGMPETDTFYDLCNRYGIMVMQEWPTAWNSENNKPEWEAVLYGETRYGQPYDLLEETVRLNTLRLRNNPSLVIWDGGNEGDNPYGEAIDMMGRYAYELDGTRPFHRQEGGGGTWHDYTLYWGRDTMDHAITAKMPVFLGEWGSASAPNYESVMRYLPDSEKYLWPAPADGSFAYHTPVFNTKNDMDLLTNCAAPFMQADTMKDFIWGSQMAQATLIRHITDRLRSNWPRNTGALHYKLNDNYPGASWSTIDWYGTPKMSYYLTKQSLAPLHSTLITESVDFYKRELSLPVYLFDDSDELNGYAWQVTVRAFNADMDLIETASYEGYGSAGRVSNPGIFTLTAAQTATTPLMIVCEVRREGILLDRVYDWFNYERNPGCILKLKGTTIKSAIDGCEITVSNTGEKPAVGIHFVVPSGGEKTFTATDNFFWLDAGESKTVTVNNASGVGVDCWNKL